MRMRFLSVFLIMAGSVACGADSGPATPPTSPSPPGTATTPPAAAPSFAGVWQGEYRVTACTGERHCTQSIGGQRAFTLRLEQSGSTVAGVFSGDVNANVSGTVGAGGELVLTGGAVAVSRFDANVDLQRLTLRAPGGSALAGSLDYTVTYPQDSPYLEATGPGSARSGEITRAVRTAGGDGSRFDGAWRGRFVVRACAAVGWADCYPRQSAELVDVELELRQNGAAVEGTIAIPPHRIPIRGSSDGARLRLDGEVVVVVSGGREVLRLSEWSATRDHVGRLQGRFTYDVAYQQDTGGTLSTRYDNELVGVVLSP